MLKKALCSEIARCGPWPDEVTAGYTPSNGTTRRTREIIEKSQGTSLAFRRMQESGNGQSPGHRHGAPSPRTSVQPCAVEIAKRRGVAESMVLDGYASWLFFRRVQQLLFFSIFTFLSICGL